MSERKGLTAKLPLKLLTPLALVLPVLVVVGVTGVVAYFQGKAAASSLGVRGVEQVHGRIGDRLRALLDGPPRWHALVEANIRSGDLDPADLRSWVDPVYQQRHAFDEALAGVTWGDPLGKTFWVFRYPGKPFWEFGILDEQTGGKLIEYPMEPLTGAVDFDAGRESEYDPRTRPWYQLGSEAGAEGAWGEPYVWLVGQMGGARNLGLPFAAAVLDSAGNIQGVLDTEIGLAELSVFLRGLTIGESGLAVITDQSGRLIATSTGATLADDELNRIAALDSSDGDIRAMAEKLSGLLPEGKGIPPAQWTGEVELERGPALMSVSAFKHGRGLNWTVMTAVPTADFTAEVEAIRGRGLRIVLVSVGITLLLGMALAAWLVRPVLRLTSHARQVGEGDLDTTLELNQASELVELSSEFNNMTAGLRERLLLRKSLRHASEVQQSLLPNADPVLPGFEIVGHCNYCDETGGDYYDYLADGETDERGAAVVVGDVMGHGIAAAMLMATARGVLRSRSHDGGSIAELLTHLNQLLVDVTGGMKFMTMLIANFDPAPGSENRQMQWASAGHDAPMIYEPGTDSFREPDGGGLPLGVMEEEVYELAEPEKLTPGTIVLIATDGMWETRNPDGEMHGKERLQESIRRHAKKSAAEIRDGLLNDLHAFRGVGPQDDDETFVVIKVAERID
ncbi:MAG: SpoIIE family protein phosphatase [Planctomycetota bacterium]